MNYWPLNGMKEHQDIRKVSFAIAGHNSRSAAAALY